VLDVKKFLCFATVVACLASFSLSAHAQGSPGSVAVIDISRIFKEHQRFRSSLEFMKKDVETAEAGLRKDAEELKKMAENLKSPSNPYAPGSQQYKQQEEAIATKQAQIQLKMNLQKKEFMEQEAKIYYQVYTEIETEVERFAKRYGINLVLRYNDIEMTQDSDRQLILAGVNRPVVYQNNIDITNDILKAINPPVNPASNNPNGSAVRPRPQGFIPPQ
jgi:Skp family chaperone for outer membrane proteins